MNFKCTNSNCDNLSPEDTCMYGYSEKLSKAVKDGTPMCEELRKKVVEYERILKSCGNCLRFTDEDCAGEGFCDEFERVMFCYEAPCVRWKERPDDNTRSHRNPEAHAKANRMGLSDGIRCGF